MTKTLQVTQTFVPVNRRATLCNHSMTPKGAVIHETGNDASAMNEAINVINNNYWRSFHVAVDDYRAVQLIPFNLNSWSTGDGAHGKGNRTQIAIEICGSKSGGAKYYAAKDNAAYYAAELMVQFGWKVAKNCITKHQDYSGKHCPDRMLDEGKYSDFVATIQKYYDEITAPKVVAKPITKKECSWKVQAGAFKTRAAADAQALKLNNMGIKTYVYKVTSKTTSYVWKLQVGAYTNQADAVRYANSLDIETYVYQAK